MSSEAQIDTTRRRLYALVEVTHTRIGAAAVLLRHKAAASPKSAEAEAHALLAQAKQDIERWLVDAGELVGVEFNAEGGMLNAESKKGHAG